MAGPTAFDGSIPALYDRLLGPMIFEPYARDLAARVARAPHSRGVRVLEVACGTGRLTRHLLEQLGTTSTITATDLSVSMLAEAQRLVGVDARLTWREADAMALPFDDGAFDLVACQFGVMFFPDKPQGLAEMFRVLAPGGRLAFNTWDSMEANPYAAVSARTIRGLFTDDPPTFFDIPFGLHDHDLLRALAEGAGFTHVQVTARPDTAKSARALDAATGFVRGNPMINALVERGVADIDGIVKAVEGALMREFGDAPMRSPMQAVIVTGQRPGARE